jgi:hypothetical protein
LFVVKMMNVVVKLANDVVRLNLVKTRRVAELGLRVKSSLLLT